MHSFDFCRMCVGCLKFCVFADNGKGKGSPNGRGQTKSGAARSFTFRQLATATRNFKETNLIGEGGFGKVYKGRLDAGEVNSQSLPDLVAVEGSTYLRSTEFFYFLNRLLPSNN